MTATVSTVDVPTDDGVADAYLAVPAGAGRHPGVLLYMDGFGLRPRLREMAERLANSGYVVLVPNVYYRDGRAPLFDLGDLTLPENRPAIMETLRPLIATVTPERAARDAEAFLEYLANSDDVSEGPVGTVGYCMGGALAIRAGAHAPQRVAAVASFHGGRLATDQPDSPHTLVGEVRAEVYVAHADNDASMPPDQQQTLSEALSAAGLRYHAEVYEGAAHGFTMSDTAAYNADAEARHWDNLLALYARTLHQP